MISNQRTLSSVVRWAAPLVWRSDRRTAHKLFGFACTEAGSALDMLKAAELTSDPKLRRLFFRHAMDEARHAQMFRAHARLVAPADDVRANDYALIAARRQNLYQQMGLVRFVAFVHLAEAQGKAHFSALRRHFADHPALERLFDRVARDEAFHVAYSRSLLSRWSKAGRAREVRRALTRVRWRRYWDHWRRMGRRIGDLLSGAVLAFLYVTVIPLFAVLQRVDRRRAGWRSRLPGDAASLRRQGL